MSDNDDQLAALGQAVLDQLLAAYDPDNDPELALAVVPGKAVSDPLSLSGQVNSLRVSEWLHVSYDDPLLLRLADCTQLSGPFGSEVPWTRMYALIAQYARPAGDPTSPAAQRVAAMIEDAQRELGPDPAVLPLGSDPEDWAEAAATCWRVFDKKVTTSLTTTTPGQPPPPASPTPPRAVNPLLWRLRALPPQAFVEASTRAQEPAQQELQVAESEQAVLAQPVAQEFRGASAANVFRAADTVSFALPAQEISVARAGRVALGAQALDPGVAAPAQGIAVSAQEAAGEFQTRIRPELLEPVLHQLRHLDLDTVAAAPTVAVSTTQSSDLHVHFEHCLITITRLLSGRPWWHQDLLHDDGWYIPGMSRGELVAEPTISGTAHCLPRALLLLRNLTISGTWTADAQVALGSAVPAIGPFLMAPLTGDLSAEAGQETTVLGLGTQVIGILGTPMPVLPPLDAPR